MAFVLSGFCHGLGTKDPIRYNRRLMEIVGLQAALREDNQRCRAWKSHSWMPNTGGVLGLEMITFVEPLGLEKLIASAAGFSVPARRW